MWLRDEMGCLFALAGVAFDGRECFDNWILCLRKNFECFVGIIGAGKESEWLGGSRDCRERTWVGQRVDGKSGLIRAAGRLGQW